MTSGENKGKIPRHPAVFTSPLVIPALRTSKSAGYSGGAARTAESATHAVCCSSSWVILNLIQDLPLLLLVVIKNKKKIPKQNPLQNAADFLSFK